MTELRFRPGASSRACWPWGFPFSGLTVKTLSFSLDFQEFSFNPKRELLVSCEGKTEAEEDTSLRRPPADGLHCPSWNRSPPDLAKPATAVSCDLRSGSQVFLAPRSRRWAPMSSSAGFVVITPRPHLSQTALSRAPQTPAPTPSDTPPQGPRLSSCSPPAERSGWSAQVCALRAHTAKDFSLFLTGVDMVLITEKT